MGYTTEFTGQVGLDKPLSRPHREYLRAFSETRRMWRDAKAAARAKDPLRRAVGLPIGDEGAFFVGSKAEYGQDYRGGVMDYNEPPITQPGLWCKWEPNEAGTAIIWTGAEKFYDYVQWMRYLVDNFLKPWGYVANGSIEWEGEDPADKGTITVVNNVVLPADARHVDTFMVDHRKAFRTDRAHLDMCKRQRIMAESVLHKRMKKAVGAKT